MSFLLLLVITLTFLISKQLCNKNFLYWIRKRNIKLFLQQRWKNLDGLIFFYVVDVEGYLPPLIYFSSACSFWKTKYIQSSTQLCFSHPLFESWKHRPKTWKHDRKIIWFEVQSEFRITDIVKYGFINLQW